MARRGRPPLPDSDAIRAYLRFVELYADGRGITDAEDEMLQPGEVCKRLTSRQAVRKRRVKGEFMAFCATAMLADFSYKTDRK